MDQEKTVAIVTGASRGIGQSIAKQLGQEGNKVIIGTATSESGEKLTNM